MSKCSGYIDGSTHCKHGHPQSKACIPRYNTSKDKWTPNYGPCCTDEEKTVVNVLNTKGKGNE